MIVRGFGLEGEVVVTDLYEVTLFDLDAPVDALAVDFDPIERVEVVDEDRTIGPRQTRVATRDVTFHEPDGVSLHPPNGDVIPIQWDDGRLAFVVLDDELEDSGHTLPRGNLTIWDSMALRLGKRSSLPRRKPGHAAALPSAGEMRHSQGQGWVGGGIRRNWGLGEAHVGT